MKLWLKGISGSWCETAGGCGSGAKLHGRPCPVPAPDLQHPHSPVTQGSLWLLREPQGSAEPRLVSAPQTCIFILDTAAPSLPGLTVKEGSQCTRPWVGAGSGAEAKG